MATYKRVAEHDADWLRLSSVPSLEGCETSDDELESWIVAAYSDFPEMVGNRTASLQATTRDERLGDDVCLDYSLE